MSSLKNPKASSLEETFIWFSCVPDELGFANSKAGYAVLEILETVKSVSSGGLAYTMCLTAFVGPRVCRNVGTPTRQPRDLGSQVGVPVRLRESTRRYIQF